MRRWLPATVAVAVLVRVLLVPATVLTVAVPASAEQRAGLEIRAVGVSAGASSATISWDTSQAARSWVEIGIDGSYGVWVPAQNSSGGGQSAAVTALAPGRDYQFRIVAVAGSSRVESKGSFTTDAVPAPRKLRFPTWRVVPMPCCPAISEGWPPAKA